MTEWDIFGIKFNTGESKSELQPKRTYQYTLTKEQVRKLLNIKGEIIDMKISSGQLVITTKVN